MKSAEVSSAVWTTDTDLTAADTLTESQREVEEERDTLKRCLCEVEP